MAATIYVPADEVWEYFEANEASLETISDKKIAENDSYGIEIWLGIECKVPRFTVLADDDEIDARWATTKSDCDSMAKELYEEYMEDYSPSVVITVEDDERELIEDREAELDDIIYSMVLEMIPNLDDVADNPEEVCEDLKNHICEYLYKKHDISVYRPMYLMDEDGKKCFEEHPYEEMEFEDE